jgi:hypothetical protein
MQINVRLPRRAARQTERRADGGLAHAALADDDQKLAVQQVRHLPVVAE